MKYKRGLVMHILRLKTMDPEGWEAAIKHSTPLQHRYTSTKNLSTNQIEVIRRLHSQMFRMGPH